MRITNNTMNRTFLNNVNKSMKRMMRAQERATTGKAVSKPSDDPLLVGKILSMRDNIEQNEQYNTNISDALGWVKTQDTALNDVNKTMNRVRDLIIYGANGSLSDTDRNAIKNEVKESLEELKDVLNTNFDGRYIFAGQKTNKPPFEGNLVYEGKGGDISRGIAQGVSIDLKTQGDEIITLDNGRELGSFLNDVLNAMEKDGDTSALSGELLAEADEFIDNILRFRSQVGAIQNRLESSEERNKTENINLKEVLSEKEDVDLAESYMEYIMMTTGYQASLSMGAKILQPSLMDYLR